MSISTERKNDIVFVRFTSDLVSANDGVTIKWVLEQALSKSTRNIAVSVTVGSLANQRLISRLLRQCREIVRRGKGKLFFVELCDGEKSVYRSICDSLRIPLYNSEETLCSAGPSPIMA